MAMSGSAYNQLRLKNLEDNKRILATFGLLDPFKSVHIRHNRKTPAVRRTPTLKRPRPSDTPAFVGGSVYGLRRKSARIEGKEVSLTPTEDLSTQGDEDESRTYTPKVPSGRPNFYGAVPDIAVGTSWQMRMECCRDGVHRPPVCGIHGGADGAYSIALSGGYEDDVDMGECFTYTGEGGRDLKGTKNNPKNLRTAAQSKDQDLTRGNLALSRNVETKNPVRVIRGYKLTSCFAPAKDEGYRYDGLYTVEKAWFTSGLSGFGVWKFALKRCEDQAPPPWTVMESKTSEEETHKSVSLKESLFDKDSESSNDGDDAVSVGSSQTSSIGDVIKARGDD